MAIKKVAIIGAGGIAGLASIYELLHTNRDGTSTVGDGVSNDPFFTKIVGFEQKADIGGTWNVEGYSSDPGLPTQEILDTETYDSVYSIRSPNKNKPSESDLRSSSFEKTITTSKDPTYLQWARSGLYPRLYTNVSQKYMKYSTAETLDAPPKDLDPFITHQQLHKRMSDFTKEHNLKKYIRFNTEVYNIRKEDDHWIITLRSYDHTQDHWYEEAFDGIILAQGSFTIPYVPHYKGLSEYNKRYPGSILHAKSYRDPLDYKDKRVIIVGGNISAIDIGQYLAQISKKVIISRDLSRDPYLDYMARCINSFENVELIEEFLPETKQIRLKTGEILNDIDHVILATGYHIELPFLEKGILNYSIPPHSKVPTSNSRIKGLYQHIFNIEDPSIAFVGKLIVQTLFRNMESEAAAIAGVWSGIKSLPSKEEQYEWERSRLSETDEHLFHKYDIYKIKEDYFDKVKTLYPIGRPDPLGHLLDSLNEYEHSLVVFERLFNEFKDGKIDTYHEF